LPVPGKRADVVHEQTPQEVANVEIREERVAVDERQLLELAWRLVADFKAEPDVLLHLDTTRWRGAIQKLELEISADQTKAWPDRFTMLLTHLAGKQPRLGPNPLWLAWMRHVHAVKVAGLQLMPVASAIADPTGEGTEPDAPDTSALPSDIHVTAPSKIKRRPGRKR
jgi:hypothetical protein